MSFEAGQMAVAIPAGRNSVHHKKEDGAIFPERGNNFPAVRVLSRGRACGLATGAKEWTPSTMPRRRFIKMPALPPTTPKFLRVLAGWAAMLLIRARSII